ncbi:uncharacterized protein B0H64DRAFT_409699 [Chaetomium fimeti]|uniref:HMG box domain-containing protein n=1 Tax=Chaetomium fimeti TaxID=1854472 RepID=A0AAE0LNQ9_9PEZI|nr:hypothetical protein B0H64DRAFT_409699 [Chaetomium fimeti]
MAEPRGNNSDSGFANREEDWPEPDVHIPIALYDKARDHQDQLTEPERQLFLSRGDIVAKALGSPDSLTDEEIHQACGWPSPDVVRANIQDASGGSLSTPAELYAKIKGALENGQFDTAVSDEEACLIVHSFRALDDYWSKGGLSESHDIPGHGHALTLLTRRLGSDITLFKTCGHRSFEPQCLPGSRPQLSPADAIAAQDRADRLEAIRKLTNAIASAEDQAQRGVISVQEYFTRVDSIRADILAIDTSDLIPEYIPPSDEAFQLLPPNVPFPSLYDRIGSGPWPASHRSIGGFNVFHRDTGFSGSDSASLAAQLWAPLTEDQKEAYRARAEVKRREAWAEYETRLARQDANPNGGFRLSGFQVFRNEQIAGNDGVGFGEVLARWEALTREQREPYEQRAKNRMAT